MYHDDSFERYFCLLHRKMGSVTLNPNPNLSVNLGLTLTLGPTLTLFLTLNLTLTQSLTLTEVSNPSWSLTLTQP